MTAEIQQWLRQVDPLIPFAERNVLEVGSLNINGTARDCIQHSEWVGIDQTQGKDVDIVCRLSEISYRSRYRPNVIVACEALEHDPLFWETLEAIWFFADVNDAYVIITTPALAFPYHSYGGDFYRFTEDTYRQVFFRGRKILDFSTVGTHPFQTNCAIGHA